MVVIGKREPAAGFEYKITRRWRQCNDEGYSTFRQSEKETDYEIALEAWSHRRIFDRNYLGRVSADLQRYYPR